MIEGHSSQTWRKYTKVKVLYPGTDLIFKFLEYCTGVGRIRVNAC